MGRLKMTNATTHRMRFFVCCSCSWGCSPGPGCVQWCCTRKITIKKLDSELTITMLITAAFTKMASVSGRGCGFSLPIKGTERMKKFNTSKMLMATTLFLLTLWPQAQANPKYTYPSQAHRLTTTTDMNLLSWAKNMTEQSPSRLTSKPPPIARVWVGRAGYGISASGLLSGLMKWLYVCIFMLVHGRKLSN